VLHGVDQMINVLLTGCNLDERGIEALQDALAANNRDRTIDMDNDKAKKKEKKSVKPDLIDLTEGTDDNISASKSKELAPSVGGGGIKSAHEFKKKAKEEENATVRNDKVCLQKELYMSKKGTYTSVRTRTVCQEGIMFKIHVCFHGYPCVWNS